MPQHIRPQSTVDCALRLSDCGVLDDQIAQICGVAVKTVCRWRRHYQRQGLTRGGNHAAPPCPVCEDGPLDEGGYSLVLGLYLGDGHLVRCRRGVFKLSIVQDSRYPGLIEECRLAMQTVKPGSRPHLRRREGCTSIEAYSKQWACVFPQHGPGVKHQRMIRLETWQREIIEADPRPFLRGLFHSDGCRVTNWTVRIVAGQPKRYEYPRYFFSNRSEDILGLCMWALDLLRIAWRRNGEWSISVARRGAVAHLDEFVGPKF
jgi:hypothetical protein